MIFILLVSQTKLPVRNFSSKHLGSDRAGRRSKNLGARNNTKSYEGTGFASNLTKILGRRRFNTAKRIIERLGIQTSSSFDKI